MKSDYKNQENTKAALPPPQVHTSSKGGGGRFRPERFRKNPIDRLLPRDLML